MADVQDPMSSDRRSRALVGLLLISLAALAGALPVQAVCRRPWIPLLLLGLGILGAGACFFFLWTALALAVKRCTVSDRERDGSMDVASLLRSTMEGMEDGVLIVDREGRMVDYNPAFVALWNIPARVLEARDDALALDFALGQVKDSDGFIQRIQELYDAPGASSQDTVELWDGRVLERTSSPAILQGQPAGRVWRFRDATSRARADLFVHRLAQAVEQSPVSIVITDTAGCIEFVNPRFTELTGYPMDEALGMNPRILKSGLTPATLYEEMWATLTSGKAWAGVIQNRKKNGDLFWERATISPLRDPSGVITHYMGLKEDITVQKLLEERLRHSQKLEAVGLLAGGVAHDFNNILQVIQGYGTLMQMSQSPEDPHRTSLLEILKAAERASQLTHSLLAFSRKQVMNPKVLDLNQVVRNLEKLFRRIIGADIQLQVRPAAAPLQVRVDTGQIEQVLLNLANNARDAMPGGGTLVMTTERVRLDATFRQEHGFGRAGDYALLQVRDSGEGMDEGTLKRIFDPFFTTREMGRGTGLGLAMAYGILKQHNGYITAESLPGEGSVFRIYLPLDSSAPSVKEEAAAQESRVRGTETILVAEDEPSVQAIVETLLKNFGYTVLLAGDGQEAVEVYREHRDSIGLVLMDMIMPRKTGRQAFEEIREEDPGAKVLFTSGYTADFIQSRGGLGPGVDLVMKPVQPMTLLRKVREVLDR